jgi:hypothetical protein
MFYLKSNLLYRDRYQIYTGTDAGLFIYNMGQEQKIINSSGFCHEILNSSGFCHEILNSSGFCQNKNVDIKFSVHDHVSVITFIRYTKNRKIGKPNNLKFWEQYNQRDKTG